MPIHHAEQEAKIFGSLILTTREEDTLVDCDFLHIAGSRIYGLVTTMIVRTQIVPPLVPERLSALRKGTLLPFLCNILSNSLMSATL